MSGQPRDRDLEPIERASADELRALQLQRLQWSVRHAYENSAPYRAKCERAGVHPADLRRHADLAHFPFTVKEDLRASYPFGMLAVPRAQLVRIHASSGTTGRSTVVGYTRRDHRDLGGARRALDPCRRRPPRRPGAHRLWLRAVHRRARGALRGGTARLHGGADVGRPDAEAGAAHLRPEARPHHGHALLHAGDRRGVPAPGARSGAQLAARRDVRCGALDARRCARRSKLGMGLDALDIYGLSEVMGPGVASECVETKDGPVIWEDHFYPEIVDPLSGRGARRWGARRAGVHHAQQGGAAADPLPHARSDRAAAADRARRCVAWQGSPAARTTC